MTTPTGQISLGDCNVEIMQRAFGTQIGIWEPGDRLSYTGQRDMAALRKAWGATITDGTYNAGKFGFNYGWGVGLMGAINDTTINNGGPVVYCPDISWSTYVSYGVVNMEDALGGGAAVAGFNGTDVDHFSVNYSRKTITSRFGSGIFWTPQTYFDGAYDEVVGLKYYA
jgi:hypothetical protein